jgi:hypothetical protein
MPRNSRQITRTDVMDLAVYETIRPEKREESILRKRFRRLSVGPHCTVTFENWDSLWLQVQEMLRIEKGGEDQIVDELAAYNSMVPNGRELTATLMFEIDDPVVRGRFLGQLGGVEDHIFLSIDGERISAVPEGDTERSTPEGKASAVHFFHFPFTDAQVEKWLSGQGQAMLHIDHPVYGHIAMISEAVRRELGGDLG